MLESLDFQHAASLAGKFEHRAPFSVAMSLWKIFMIQSISKNMALTT